MGLGTRGLGDAGGWDAGTQGRRDVGCRDAGTRGLGDAGMWYAGTQGRGDARTRGRRDVGCRDAGTQGREDSGTPGCGMPGRRDAGTPGSRDAGTWDSGKWDAGTRGRDKQLKTFLVSNINCVFLSIPQYPFVCTRYFDANVYFRKTVVHKCTFLLFSFLECADTRNDLELESEWKPEKIRRKVLRALTEE